MWHSLRLAVCLALLAQGLVVPVRPAAAARVMERVPVSDLAPNAAIAALRSMPSPVEQERLVAETMSLFLSSLAARSTAALHAQASSELRRQVGLPSMDATFRPFFDAGVALPGAGSAPVLTSPPKAFGTDAFVVEGRWKLDGRVMSFDLAFAREGFDWRWSYLNVDLSPFETPARGK